MEKGLSPERPLFFQKFKKVILIQAVLEFSHHLIHALKNLLFRLLLGALFKFKFDESAFRMCERKMVVGTIEYEPRLFRK